VSARSISAIALLYNAEMSDPTSKTKSGACDALTGSRRAMIRVARQAAEVAPQHQQHADSNCPSLRLVVDGQDLIGGF